MTCQANEAVALNRTATKDFVERNGIVVLKADKTTNSPEIDETLRLLGNDAGAIPFYAIFPAANPNKPITLDGVFVSPAPIIEALEKAGPSRGADEQASSQ
jgi:thiol:disulfide interchange protein